MDKVVYTSMGGAKVALRAQGINSHNLANINTSGFRAHLTSSEPAESGGAARVNVVRARETFSTDNGPLQSRIASWMLPLRVPVGWSSRMSWVAKRLPAPEVYISMSLANFAMQRINMYWVTADDSSSRSTHR